MKKIIIKKISNKDPYKKNLKVRVEPKKIKVFQEESTLSSYNTDVEKNILKKESLQTIKHFQSDEKPLSLGRQIIFDVLRVTAIAFMIFTHVIAVVYDHKDTSSRIIHYIGLAGGLMSFLLFLFISGASSYLSILQIPSEEKAVLRKKKFKLIVRSFQILLAYYFLALFYLIISKNIFLGDFSFVWIKDFLKVILFLRVIEFTEFLVPFIAFNLSVVLFHSVYRAFLKTPLIGALFSAGIYLLGYLVYTIDFSNAKFNILKSWFAGHGELHTFPLFQYFCIFLLGIFIGKSYLELKRSKQMAQFRGKINVVLFIILSSSTALDVIFYFLYQGTKIELFNLSVYDARFPPSLGFLSAGLTGVFAFMLIFEQFTSLFSKFSFIQKSFTYLSKNALSMLVVHAVIIFILKYSDFYTDFNFFQRYSTFYEVLSVFLSVFFLSILIILIRDCFLSEIFSILTRKNNVKGVQAIGIILVSILLLVLLAQDISGGSFNSKESFAGEYEKTIVVDSDPENWFDYSYKYRSIVQIERSDQEKIYENSGWGAIRIDHIDYLSRKISFKEDGKDMTLVSYNKKSDVYTSLKTVVKNPNSNETVIYFQNESLNFDPNVIFYLYTGSNFVNADTQDVSDLEDSIKDSAVILNISDPVSLSVSLDINKKWHLIRTDTTDNLILTGNIKNYNGTSKVKYTINDSEGTQEIVVQSDGTFSHEIDISSLSPGEYYVEVSSLDLSNGINLYRSNKLQFIVSYPLYYTWSIDWEGWGVAQSDLNEISDISSKYGISLTQFFNPRIFVKDQFSTFKIDSASANYFVSWVKLRQAQNGDEIGLHLHMYTDMLQEVGVEGTVCEEEELPVSYTEGNTKTCTTITKKPRLIGVGTQRDEGILSAYSAEEFSKVIEWALEKFEDNGLKKPVSFRSGAWMSAPHILKVLEEHGFLIDSSGRTSGLLDPAYQYSTPIPWNLTATTTPYMPSETDMNSSTGTDLINIWEFPNNGADSYWFTVEDLINRFNVNYPDKNKAMTYPQALTILSHPHGFVSYDSQKIRGILDYVSKYQYKNDEGPVVFSTLENIYYQWDKDGIDGE